MISKFTVKQDNDIIGNGNLPSAYRLGTCTLDTLLPKIIIPQFDAFCQIVAFNLYYLLSRHSRKLRYICPTDGLISDIDLTDTDKNNPDLVKWAEFDYDNHRGYVWGLHGQVLTEKELNRLNGVFGSHVTDEDAYIREHWLGTAKQPVRPW